MVKKYEYFLIGATSLIMGCAVNRYFNEKSTVETLEQYDNKEKVTSPKEKQRIFVDDLSQVNSEDSVDDFLEEEMHDLISKIPSIEHKTVNEKRTISKRKNLSYESISPKLIPELPLFLDPVPVNIKSLNDVVDKEYVVGIEKGKQLLTVYQKNGNGWDRIKDYIISTGANKGNKERRGDMKTPEGKLHIIEIQNSRNWFFEGEKAYGEWFLRLSGWTSIGIHGTNEPELLGRRVSHGCIRMYTEDDIELKENYVNVGTYVIIGNSFRYSFNPIEKIMKKDNTLVKNIYPHQKDSLILARNEAYFQNQDKNIRDKDKFFRNISK